MQTRGRRARFEKLHGQDPAAYIFSVNVARRNLTKGQKAMALAMIYLEGEGGKGGRGQPNREGSSEVSGERHQQARAVLRYSSQLAEAVMKGTTPLNER